MRLWSTSEASPLYYAILVGNPSRHLTQFAVGWREARFEPWPAALQSGALPWTHLVLGSTDYRIIPAIPCCTWCTWWRTCPRSTWRSRCRAPLGWRTSFLEKTLAFNYYRHIRHLKNAMSISDLDSEEQNWMSWMSDLSDSCGVRLGATFRPEFGRLFTAYATHVNSRYTVERITTLVWFSPSMIISSYSSFGFPIAYLLTFCVLKIK